MLECRSSAEPAGPDGARRRHARRPNAAWILSSKSIRCKSQQQQNILWEWGDVLIIFKQIRLGTVSLTIKVDSIYIAHLGGVFFSSFISIKLMIKSRVFVQNSAMRPSPPTHPASQPSPHPQPPTPHSQMMPGQVLTQIYFKNFSGLSYRLFLAVYGTTLSRRTETRRTNASNGT